MRIKNLVSIAIAASFMLFASSRAEAALEIALQQVGVNGGAITTVAAAADFTAVSFSGVFGDFAIAIQGGSSDNGATLSDLLASTTSVRNLSGSSSTLRLYVTQNNYTLPAGTTLSVESGAGGSISTGTLALPNIFQAYADKNNALYGTGDFTSGPQSATQTGSTFDTGSAIGLFTRTGLYSLTSVMNFTLSGGGIANFANHVNVSVATAVAEPGSILLLATGLFGLAGSPRRRLRGAVQ